MVIFTVNFDVLGCLSCVLACFLCNVLVPFGHFLRFIVFIPVFLVSQVNSSLVTFILFPLHLDSFSLIKGTVNTDRRIQKLVYEKQRKSQK